MKRLKTLTLCGVFAMLNVAFADDLSIKILRDIKFSNGFGQIEGKPILKDKNISKDIKVMGEYNVEEKNGNVIMKIDKVLYGGKIYDLSEEFNTKRRLKNVKTAQLKKGAKIKLSGGSHPEFLAILNGEAVSNSKKNSDGKSSNSSASSASNTKSSDSTGSSYYGGSSSRYGSGSSSPYLLGSGSSGSGSSSDKSSPTTDSNGNCKSPEIRDGMAYVYPLINGVCTQKAIDASNVYKKQNTSTCPNKTDYENMSVSIGEEQYAIIDDTEYRVKSCYYSDAIALQATTESCNVIPDYPNKQGFVQKQYWYILNNERVNVGSCVPTKEVIALYDDDYNSCQYRYDFENGKAIKQTQWYYIYENEKKTIGECVDVSEEKLAKMTYPMYETAQGCDCNEVDGAKLCQTKLSFNGMANTKIDATECRYIDAEGVGLKDEFVGNYSFKDDSRQAVKKINQYFLGVGGEKIYVTKDRETNKSYPYKELSCGWEHINDKKMSYHKTKFVIKDPELLTLSADILASNPKIQGDEYEIKDCSAVVQSVLYWQMQLELAKGKKTGEHKRQVLVPENLDPQAKKWSLPMIKTKDSSGRTYEPMLEDGQKPIWDSNFKANGYVLYSQEKQETEKMCYLGAKKQSSWNLYPSNLKLNGGGVDNIPESIGIGWATEYYQVDSTCYRQEQIPNCIGNENESCIQLIPYPCKVTKSRTVGLNNPLSADSKLSMAYSISLDSPIIIKPTKIDMNENITNDNSAEDAIYYQTITKNIIDPNTKQCVKYPDTEFVLDSNGKKQCVGNQLTEEVAENDKNKKVTKPKVDSNGNPVCDAKGYKKHADWNEAKKGQCKTQEIRLYTTGVTFTPNYDESPIDLSKQYCKAGEQQSFEAIEEKEYKVPEDLTYDTDDNGNATNSADGKSSYYKMIEKIKYDALNVANYQKSITKILCSADNEDSNKNAYIIGAVVNHYKAKNGGLTKLEVESLKNMNMQLYANEWKTKRTVRTIKRCTWHKKEDLKVSFATKDNWANNQRIYEHEMYRPFRRPDGTTFYLYERQGFFSSKESSDNIECPDCARDDEING